MHDAAPAWPVSGASHRRGGQMGWIKRTTVARGDAGADRWDGLAPEDATCPLSCTGSQAGWPCGRHCRWTGRTPLSVDRMVVARSRRPIEDLHVFAQPPVLSPQLCQLRALLGGQAAVA